jgi:hypothetical protein
LPFLDGEARAKVFGDRKRPTLPIVRFGSDNACPMPKMAASLIDGLASSLFAGHKKACLHFGLWKAFASYRWP